MQVNFSIGDPLSLERIRSVLNRLEDTIIFGLIERAQFAYNPKMYQRGAFKELGDLGFEGSWLDWFLKEIETFHGQSLDEITIHRAKKKHTQPKHDATRGTSLCLHGTRPKRLIASKPGRIPVHIGTA